MIIFDFLRNLFRFLSTLGATAERLVLHVPSVVHAFVYWKPLLHVLIINHTTWKINFRLWSFVVSAGSSFGSRSLIFCKDHSLILSSRACFVSLRTNFDSILANIKASRPAQWEKKATIVSLSCFSTSREDKIFAWLISGRTPTAALSKLFLSTNIVTRHMRIWSTDVHTAGNGRYLAKVTHTHTNVLEEDRGGKFVY